MAENRLRLGKRTALGGAALMLVGAAPGALRLDYDPAVLIESACLAPDYRGVRCPGKAGSLRSELALPSAAAIGADAGPRLAVDLRGLIDWGPELSTERAEFGRNRAG